MFLHQIEESLNIKRQRASLLKENEVATTNPVDTATVDVPLLIRLMEYAREDAKTDMDLHDVAERMISLSAGGKTLTMSDYESITSGKSSD